ncbi:T9SS type A sorting domain-containing protein [Polaribacter sp. M15]
MKKTLLFIALITSATLFGQTNLVVNGSGENHGSSSDNADAFDMTPNSKLDGDVVSPYRYDEDNNPNGWNNTALETYIKDTYAGGNNPDEQPGSTSDGAYVNGVKTRGFKLYDDGDDSPTITASTRRLYQKITVEVGQTYVFSIDSRSEAKNVPSEIFMLNEEITTEVGLENGISDPRVDAYLEVTNDYNSSKGSETDNTFTTNTLEFTASTTTVVVYVRAMAAINKSTEVFYDNISLIKKQTASVDDVFTSKTAIYPNPASQFVNISSELEISKVDIYNLLGKKVMSTDTLNNNVLEVSNLSSGIYMMKLVSGNLVASKKLIIK